MSNDISTSKTRRPVCGIASFLFPLGVATVEYLVTRFIRAGDSGALTLYVLGAYLLVASVIAGAILAAIALGRREKWKALSSSTLALNLIAIVLLFKFLI